jgi:hypothetical protein
MKLVEDWHNIKTIEHSRLVFEYDKIFGDLEYELNKKNSEAEILQDKIDKLIRKNSRNNYNRPNNCSFEFNESKEERDNRTATLYRKIVKKLHPDTCGDSKLNAKYWDKVQTAYKSKNNRHLEIIYNTITVDYNKLEVNQIENEIVKLEKYISEENNNLEKLKHQEPYVYKNKLKDQLWINQRKISLENKLDQAESRLSLKRKIYSNMIKRRENIQFAN